MASKYYFVEDLEYFDEERCYQLKHIKEAMREDDIKEIKVHEAVRDDMDDYFFRGLHGAGEKGDCGKACSDYEPRNKIKGICKWHGFLYELGESKIINIK